MTEDELDRPREACGVFGVYTDPAERVDVARLTFFALYALQHRGQESAGIAACDGVHASIERGMGLVSQVFTEEKLRPIQGHLGIGHNRYSTTGSSHIRNAQPYLFETRDGPLGVGHNGNLTNVGKLRRRLLERGVGLTSSSDSEVITQMLAEPVPGDEGRPDWEGRILRFMEVAEGAYCLVILTRNAVYAVRDPQGLRPLCLGALLSEDGQVLGHAVASESCALGTVGAAYLREVQPGEILRLDADGVTSIQGPRAPQRSLCVFEYVYFARPDSDMDEQSIHATRVRMGRQLALESPIDADVVIGVPDSAVASAIGFSHASGIPYSEGLIKNRYIGRTFIQPTDRLRRSGVRLKYNPLRENLEGKRVVMVDDSIVRGTTMGPLVRLLREGGGAREVHIRVCSPPVRHPCFMGVDLATHQELIAHRLSVEAIRAHVGADSLAYLSVDGMLESVRSGIKGECGHCAACFTGKYPLDVSEFFDARSAKLAFEGPGADR